MYNLESLQAITQLAFFVYDFHDIVNQFGPVGVVPLCPVIPRTGGAERKVVRSEQPSVGPRTDGIQSSWL